MAALPAGVQQLEIVGAEDRLVENFEMRFAKLFTSTGLALGVALASAPAVAQPSVLKPVRELQTPVNFKGAKGASAQDLSGVACSSQAGPAARVCLVIDDQEAHAQIASLTSEALTAGATVPLLNGPLVGEPPTLKCGGGASDSQEVDGEGVSVVGDTFYVVGSHGCSRNKDKFKQTAFELIRFTLTSEGVVASSQQRTHRVTDLLAGSKAAGWLGRNLKNDHGLNIEGVAIRGNDIYIGLRGPGARGRKPAMIVQGSLGYLFDSKTNLDQKSVSRRKVALASGLGVRDMAILDDQRLMLLTGPETEGPARYELAVFHPITECVAVVGALEDRSGVDGRAKAEGVAVLSTTSDKAEVMVVYDGIINGGPQIYEVNTSGKCTQ